jgi:L-threonylcarbamoyladenylate synthase
VSVVDRIDLRGDPEADLGLALAHLEKGGVLAYPTETVYGLGGPVTADAVGRVQRLKGREEDRPLLILVGDRDDVTGLRWTEPARELADAFWPGAVTLVLSDPDGVFPSGVRSPSGGVGVRVSPHPLVGRLLSEWGRPLTSTSLNEPGRAPARTGTEAAGVAQGMHEEIVLLDGGTLPPSAPSTVIDCTGAVPVVLRPGSVPVERIRCVVPETHGHVPG